MAHWKFGSNCGSFPKKYKLRFQACKRVLFSILFLYGAFFTTHFCTLPSVLATKYCPLSMFLFSISFLDFLFFSWNWGVFFNRLIRCSTYISEISIQKQFSTKLNSLGLRFLKFQFWTNGLRPHNSFPYGSQQLHELQNITISVMQQIFSCKKLFCYDIVQMMLLIVNGVNCWSYRRQEKHHAWDICTSNSMDENTDGGTVAMVCVEIAQYF